MYLNIVWVWHFLEIISTIGNVIYTVKPIAAVKWYGGRVVQGADSSPLAIYVVIHISLGHISAQVDILGISSHLFICVFHFVWHFGWPVFL